jgi:hypothetical protein
MTAVNWHVTRTDGAMYSLPRKAAKRRKCDGHLAPEPHWIERGDLIMWSALPPHSDIGNTRWWHAAYCAACWPKVLR